MAVKNGKDKKVEQAPRIKKVRRSNGLQLDKQFKMDRYAEKQYRRYNASHFNDKKLFNRFNPLVQPTGKMDGNFKLAVIWWNMPIMADDQDGARGFNNLWWYGGIR